ncbi:hypothetical protein CLCR_08824 [Cladophialophora carrionii]|uniref:Zn(2)-C6 fungal-type domain-containing protein n=1 Tax=Cladophialophora carrionii TaxID=86049 RepID=A0A1C1CSP0_9EURO|nr:hypothetical protein CLCR_08824 [Cladophialophora carrionii]
MRRDSTHRRSGVTTCDEKQPACGACRKGGRPCSYTSGHGRFDRVYQVYRMDSIRQDSGASSSTSDPSRSLSSGGANSRPPAHDTTILTLRPAAYTSTFHESIPRPGCIDPSVLGQGPSRTLVREAQFGGRSGSLVLRWRNLCEIMLPGARQPYVLGEWLELIPPRIGHSETFDIALECLITSALTYVNTTERNLADTCGLNSGALARVRAMLAKGEESPKEQDDILLAISFLYAAERSRHCELQDSHARPR